jgi:hypothetical protein
MNPLNGRPIRPVRSGNNSTPAEKTAERIGGAARSLLSRLSIGGAIVISALALLLGAYLWFNHVYANPEHVFWNTIANNLSTAGITKEISQNSSSGNSDQIAQLTFVPEPRMRLLQKQTSNSSSGPISLTLESIVTPAGSYQHYLAIDRPARNGNKKRDYSSLYPLWVKGNGGSSVSTFNQALFTTAVLSGNLTSQQRKVLLDKLHPAYRVDFANVKRQTYNGRRVYVYTVAINLKKYAAADSLYANYIGMPNSAHLAAKNFRSGQQIVANFSIDVLSHEVSQIVYKNSSSTENYSGYGVRSEINPPARTVSFKQLQTALQQIR